MGVYKLEYFSKDVKALVQPTILRVKNRYDNKIRLRRLDDRLQVRPLNLSDLKSKENSQDILHTVQPFEANRPDLVALKYYGDARLYWVVLAANDLKSAKDFIDGLVIRVPSIYSVYGQGGVMS